MRRRYTLPPDVERDRHAKAKRRRAALVAAGCATYELGVRGGASAIQCLCCGLGSNNLEDIKHRYCSFCETWHSEWKEEA